MTCSMPLCVAASREDAGPSAGKTCRCAVFRACERFLGQREVEPDAPGNDIAASPAGAHLSDAPFRRADAEAVFPGGQQRRHGFAEFLPVFVKKIP